MEKIYDPNYSDSDLKLVVSIGFAFRIVALGVWCGVGCFAGRCRGRGGFTPFTDDIIAKRREEDRTTREGNPLTERVSMAG